MLLVKCRLRPSPIHGIGLFAAEPIRKGTRVWELTPGFDLVLRKPDFKHWPRPLRRFLDNYGFKYRKGVYVLSSDHAKHFNHSDTPNTRLRGPTMYAAKAVARGEELTCDYFELEDVNDPTRADGDVVVAARPRAGRA
jgi:SET domain-containing protein